MAIKKYNVIVLAEIKDIETNAKREEFFSRSFTTMHNRNSIMFLELANTIINELLEEIEDGLLDIEELVSYKTQIEG